MPLLLSQGSYILDGEPFCGKSYQVLSLTMSCHVKDVGVRGFLFGLSLDFMATFLTSCALS